jgi:hypothetical protein
MMNLCAWRGRGVLMTQYGTHLCLSFFISEQTSRTLTTWHSHLRHCFPDSPRPTCPKSLYESSTIPRFIVSIVMCLILFEKTMVKELLHSPRNVHSPKFSLIFFSFIHFFGTGSRYVSQAGLKVMIFLPQSPKCWEYMCAPQRLA